MNTNKEKLNAAITVVSNSVLHGWNIEAKIKYIKTWLPDHYEVKETERIDSVSCVSRIGIEDEEKWEYFLSALKQRFGKLFLEIDHNTCYNHVDFIIYFSK